VCFPCPTDGRPCPPCSQKGWEFKRPILLQLLSLSKLQQIAKTEESGITQEENAAIIPLHPSGVIAKVEANSVVVRWLGTGSDIIQHYKIWRRISDEANKEVVGQIKIIEDNRGWYEFKDTPKIKNKSYVYGVSAFDVYGNESIITESDPIQY